ncbi:oleosin G [Andrographis paniculata]|uniref:oleosin G n=1 Tax=Andrographis paniculata TaxID=175694 RepID=UPI0021E870B0|nr:oleosin G [Andrographis paniculata]
MADPQFPARRPASAFLQNLRDHAPSSTQLIGLATLVIAGGVLLLLTGLTLAAAVLGVVFFGPLILISSPVWIPVAALLFVAVAGILSLVGLAVAAVAVVLWLYKYFRGFHPPGSDRVDYARSRFADTAGHVKDYAREYGGYLHRKVARDAAPSA